MMNMNMKKNMLRRSEKMKWIILPLLAILIFLPSAISIDLNSDISDEDKAQFDDMLTPITKIYNLVKYSATIIAGLFLLFAGITYMMAGNDIKKRDQAKNMAGYVIIGLILIWAAPLIINYLI